MPHRYTQTGPRLNCTVCGTILYCAAQPSHCTSAPMCLPGEARGWISMTAAWTSFWFWRHDVKPLCSVLKATLWIERLMHWFHFDASILCILMRKLHVNVCSLLQGKEHGGYHVQRYCCACVNIGLGVVFLKWCMTYCPGSSFGAYFCNVGQTRIFSSCAVVCASVHILLQVLLQALDTSVSMCDDASDAVCYWAPCTLVAQHEPQSLFCLPLAHVLFHGRSSFPKAMNARSVLSSVSSASRTESLQCRHCLAAIGPPTTLSSAQTAPLAVTGRQTCFTDRHFLCVIYEFASQVPNGERFSCSYSSIPVPSFTCCESTSVSLGVPARVRPQETLLPLTPHPTANDLIQGQMTSNAFRGWSGNSSATSW